MDEIKSVRVRKKFSVGDDNRGVGDHKVILYDNGRNKFKVAAGQVGGIFTNAEYKREGRFENFTNDDFIKDGINILVSKQNNNAEFEIIQDPWLDTSPKWRSFGFDPYYLSNGAEVWIKWLLVDSTSAGGKKWSDDNGLELEISKSGEDNKGSINKTVDIFAPDSYTGQNKTLKITNLGIESVFDKNGKILPYTDELIYSGMMKDINILELLIFDWNKKVPNYNLSLCEPSFRKCEIIPYISPVEEFKLEELEDPQKPPVEKEKLNVIIPKDLKLKIKQDFSFKIFVGDPPKTELPISDGFDYGDEEDLSDLLLEDEFRESQFEGTYLVETSIKLDYVETPDVKNSVIQDTTDLGGPVEITKPKDGSMTFSEEGLKRLIKDEGSRKTVYDDKTSKSVSSYAQVKGYPTIGVGHLIKNSEKNTFSKYLKGKTEMSENEVMNLLIKDLESRIKNLNGKLKVKVTQNQFDALLSMMFNTGSGNRSFLKAIDLTNQGKFKEAGAQIKSGPKTSKGKELAGLVRRRNEESKVYLS